jgi:4-hydroxybenzoate polyprenyltransferase
LVAAMIRGMAEEEPTVRARQMVARKRVFYVVAALLFIAGVAAGAWGALSGNGVGILIFGFLMVPSVFLVLLPLGMGRYINDFDSGRQRSARRFTSEMILTASLLVIIASVISLVSSEPGSRYTPLWWVILLIGGFLAFIAIVRLLRRADPEERKSN